MAGAEDSARVRDRLASDRTLLAWLRTGISLAGLGFVVSKFGLFLEKLDRLTSKAPPRTSSQVHVSGYLGVALVVVGAVIMAIGVIQHRGMLRQEQAPPGAPRPAEWPIALASAGCLVTAVVLAGYLASSA